MQQTVLLGYKYRISHANEFKTVVGSTRILQIQRSLHLCVYFTNREIFGQTHKLQDRLSGHRHFHKRKKKDGSWYVNYPWARAVRKYGIYNMKFFILEKIAADENTDAFLNSQEKMWINFFKSDQQRFGYNSDSGGDCVKHSKETRAKMSRKLLGNKRPLGHKHSEESRRLMQVNSGSNIACIAIDKHGNETRYMSASEAARRLSTETNKFDNSSIAACMRGKYNRGKNGGNLYKTYRFKRA